MEQLDAADADRAERVTVIRVAESKEASLLGTAPLLPVLEGLLECDLDCGRAVVREEHARQSARRDLEQRGRESNSWLVRQTEVRRVRDLLELIAKRAIESRMAMAMHGAPQRADAIEVAPTVVIDEEAAVA